MHKKGISLNSVEESLPYSAEKIRTKIFCVSKEFWYRKTSSKGGGRFTVLSKFFYLTGPKKFRRGTLLCFTNFLVSKKLWIREGGAGRRKNGVPQISVEVFLSQCRKNFVE